MREIFHSETNDGWRLTVSDDDNSKPIVSPTVGLGSGFEPRPLFMEGNEGISTYFRPSAEGDATIFGTNPSIVVISGHLSDEDQARITDLSQPMTMSFLQQFGEIADMTILSFTDTENRNAFVAASLVEWPERFYYVTNTDQALKGNNIFTWFKLFFQKLAKSFLSKKEK